MSWFLSFMHFRMQAVPGWRVWSTIVLVLFFCGAALRAQDASVRGVVVDEVTGAPMPFVSVVVQGGHRGVH